MVLTIIGSPGLAWSQTLLDPAQVPGLDAAGRALYAGWLLTNTPRAVAVGSNGKVGWASGGNSLPATRTQALSLCAEHGGTACQIYAENLDVVWPGREWHPAPPPGPLVDTINYSFVPDARFLWHGPVTARGVIVWSHGKSGDADARGLQPPPFLRAFNNAGFDIVRFDRAPLVDTLDRAAGWLRAELASLRHAGYRTVVASGASHGGWLSLKMLDAAGSADAVIALSPAAHGAGVGTNSMNNQGSSEGSNLSAQDDDLRALVVAAEPSHTRVAVAQFANDPFISDADTLTRLLNRLRPKEGALLLIDRPAGLQGHFGGMGQAFSARFASCLLGFVVDPAPAAACPQAEP